MRLRKAKKTVRNSRIYVWLAMLALLVLPAFAPQPAYAYDFQVPELWAGGEVCPGVGLTRRIVPCIKETIVSAADNLLQPMEQYLQETVLLCSTLAVALWGSLIITGKTTSLVTDGAVVLIKLGCVSYFALDMSDIFPDILDAMGQLLSIVTGYVVNASYFSYIPACQDFWDPSDTPDLMVWNAVDCALNSVVGGIYTDYDLYTGVIPFLLACLTSKDLGIIVGIVGFYVIYRMMLALIKACYIFISCYIGVSVMAIIAPLIIPLILFRATRAYFARWVRTLLSFMITPMFLFAYLGMLLSAFDMVVFSGPNSFFHAVAGDVVEDPSFTDGWEYGGWGGIGGWLIENGAYVSKDLAPQPVNINQKAIQGSRFGDVPNYMPLNGSDVGAPGEITMPMLEEEFKQEVGVGELLGVDTYFAPFFQSAVNSFTVNWGWLAELQCENDGNCYDDSSSYVIDVILTTLMAMLMAYVFLELLEKLPFLGGQLAMGGTGEQKTMSSLNALTKMEPPGKDFMKSLKLNWGPKRR